MSGCCSTNTEPYALRVMGDDMWPEFPDGAIIIVDPGGILYSGAYIVIEHQGEVTFRQYVEHDGSKYLVPVNDLYPTVELEEPHEIKGVVIQQHYNRERRYYDKDLSDKAAS
jgi:SOS-response transcriptional repressor LexA